MLNRLLHSLRTLSHRRDADLDDELRAFYEASVEAKLAAGMPPEQAERAARIELGSPPAVKEWVRDVAWTTHLESLGQDARYALRLLARQPGFTVAAVLTLGCGRGVSVERAPPVVVVNESFAALAWPGRDPLGRRVFLLPQGPEFQVVGIARDGKYENLTEQGRPAIYIPPHLAGQRFSQTFMARGEGAGTIVPAIARQIREVDPGLVVTRSGTLGDRVAELAMTQRLGASLLSWFGVLAFALALAGTYGLIAYAVARRTGEIGIRIALGAQPGDVVRMMMRRSLVPVGAGIVLGMAGAYGLTKLASGFLFGIAPHDPMSFAGAALALTLGAALASYVPARRAAHVDPAAALRAE